LKNYKIYECERVQAELGAQANNGNSKILLGGILSADKIKSPSNCFSGQAHVLKSKDQFPKCSTVLDVILFHLLTHASNHLLDSEHHDMTKIERVHPTTTTA
jgi:hypothetical protein